MRLVWFMVLWLFCAAAIYGSVTWVCGKLGLFAPSSSFPGIPQAVAFVLYAVATLGVLVLLILCFTLSVEYR